MSYYQNGKIKDVNAENLIDELRIISNLLDDYNYIAMVKSNYFTIGYGIPWNCISFKPKFPIYN